MKIKTISTFSYMNYKYYLKQPMPMIERGKIMIIAKNPQIVNSLNRVSDHPLIRKYTDNPFKNYLYQSFQIKPINLIWTYSVKYVIDRLSKMNLNIKTT